MRKYNPVEIENRKHLEQSLLYYLLLGQSEDIALLSEDDFMYFECKAIFRIALDKYQKGMPFNPLEIHDYFQALKNNEVNVFILSESNQVYNIIPATYKSYLNYFKKINERDKAYTIIVNAAERLERGEEREGVLLKVTEEIINLTTMNKMNEESDIDLYKEFFNLDKPVNQSHVAYSGLRALDHNLRNLTGGRLIVIAARPGQGKSALAVQIMVNAIFKEKKVGYLSLEMGKNEIICRMMANKYEFNVSELQRGRKETIMDLMTSYSPNPFPAKHLFLNDSLFKLSAINRKIREWVEEGVSLVIVDHIGLIDSEIESTRNDQLGKISRTLKQLTQQLQIPIIALSQLNRASENEKRKPMLSDLRDSGNIEQDADAVIMFYQSNVTNDGIKIFDLGLLKNRAGLTDWLGPRFAFNGCIQRFTEMMLNVQVR